jgi:hypothetical protein
MKAEIDAKGDELAGEEDDYGATLNEELDTLENRLMDIEM